MKYIIISLTLIGTFTLGYVSKESVIIKHPTEYHFNIDTSGYIIYTEDMKEVGKLKYGTNQSLDSLINADNQ